MSTIDREEISRLTQEYGGNWGINHTRRLLALIAGIGEGLAYDEEVVWLAAHLHDWGAYAPWAQAGVDHAERSVQVAGEFLAGCELDPARLALVLACIATHHSGDPDRPVEAVLLSDADALDFLGVVGVLRDFAKKPKDLRGAYQTVKSRRATLPGMLCTPAARQLAAPRLQEMDALLAAFEAETFGCF